MMKQTAVLFCGLGALFGAQFASAGPNVDFRGRNLDRGDVNYSNPVTSTAGQRVELRWISLLASSCQAVWSPLPNGQPTPIAIDSFVVVTPTVTTSYTIRCFDSSGATDSTVTVNVGSSGGTDTTPPNVIITAPFAGQTVSGNFIVTAVASDNVGVSWVRFQLDGNDIQGAVLTAAPYTFTWNTTSAANGPHTLSAVARDTTGNTATYYIAVFVNNQTTAFAVLNPSAGQTYQVGNQIIVAWTAHPQATGYTVEFSNDGITYIPLTTAPLPASTTTFAWTPTASNLSVTARILVIAQAPAGINPFAHSGLFTIASPAPQAFLVTQPIGGAVYQAGAPIQVVWQINPTMTVNYYLVDYSSNGGQIWSTVSSSLNASTRTFTHTPTAATNEGKFRVAAFFANGSAIFAESAIFRVTASALMPAFMTHNVINAADADPAIATRGVLVPGAWWSIYGSGFGNAEVRAVTVPLPIRLADIEVLVNGQPAPLLLVKPDQINFQVPYGSIGQASLQVVNRSTGQASGIVSLAIAPSAPSLFQYRESAGNIRPIVQNWSTGQLVTASTPLSLAAGRFIILYGNAFGAVADQARLVTGQPQPASRLLDQNTTFVIDGQVQRPEQITYIGLAPGMVGAFQMNLELPAALALGRHTGVLVVGNTVLPFEFWSAP